MLKNSAIIASFGILSQILGLIRDRLFASNIGIGLNLDIYYTSFRLADLIYSVILAFVGAVTILPIISKYIAEKNDHEVQKRFNSIFFFFSILMIVISAIAFALIPWIVKFYTGHLDIDSYNTVVNVSRILLLQPILLGISNIISVLSQAHRHFIIFSVAPLFYNLGIIIGAVFFYSIFGIYGLAYGVLLGAFMHLCIQLITIYKSKFKFKYQIDKLIIKEQLNIASPRAVTLFLQQIKLIVITFFAGKFGIGSLSIFTFASTLSAIPLQFFGISYSVASFPKMSELFELNNETDFKNVANSGVKHLTILSIAATVFCFFFANIIARLIYGNTNGIDEVVTCFQVLVLALPFQTLSWFGGRVLFSRRDTFSPLISQVISFVIIFISLYYFYMNNFGLISLAYCIVLGSIFELMAILILYKTKHS